MRVRDRAVPADRLIDGASGGGPPSTSARYSRWISRRCSFETSAVWVSGVRATTRSPLVSLSSRCTSPARGTEASAPSWASKRILQGVARLPAPGCTTSPAGLLITRSASSSKHDPQCHGLGGHALIRGEFGPNPHPLASGQALAREYLAPLEQHLARPDPALQAGA